MPKIAIVTKPKNASPKVLAKCLHDFLKDNGCRTELFFKIDVFKRLLKYSAVKKKYNFITWMLFKAIYYIPDKLFIQKLKGFDAIIIAETCPRVFYKDLYDFIQLKKLMGNIPLIYHEVYYVGTAPTLIDLLGKKRHHSPEIFDWHLAASPVSEIRLKPSPPWSQIGLYLKSSGLKPAPKKELFALVDFERRGHEETRRSQIETLEALNIPYVALNGRFTIAEIREYYKRAAFYFIQFREAFGVPIAECLSCGSYIFTPDNSWAMAWRLDEAPQIHGPGTLADCFVVYDGHQDLKRKLEDLKNTYDLTETPKKVFEVFYENYPSYYEGNVIGLQNFLTTIENREIIVKANQLT